MSQLYRILHQDCKQKAILLSEFENQLEQYLSSIQLPKNYQDLVMEAYKREDEEGPGFEKQRQELENRLKRLKTLFTWGDMPEEDYKAQRDQIRSDLAALPPATSSKSSEVERLAKYLQNVGQAWRDANPEQRNRLAKTLFENIRIEDNTIKGVTPQIEFTPLLVLSHFEKCQGSIRKSGSDGANTDNYEKMGLSLHERQEILDPIFVPKSFQFKGPKKPLSRYSTPRTQIPQDKWQENCLSKSRRRKPKATGCNVWRLI